MSGSLDDLIQFLLDEIAISGQQGRTVAELLGFVEQFYRNVHEKKISLQSEDDTAPKISRPKVDRRLQERVWRWLIQHPDFRVGKDGKRKSLSLSEAEQQSSIIASPQPSGQPGATSKPETTNGPEDTSVTARPSQHLVHSLQPGSNEELRVYVTEDRMWQAICGHPKDLTKVFEMEFRLLSVIAIHRENGIVQGDLIKQSGQDKRSVPKRTDALQRKGYIEKRQILLGGNRTSRLTLKAYSSPDANKLLIKPAAVNEKETIDVDVLLRDIFAIIRSKTIMTQLDLRTQLQLTSPRQARLLVKTVRRLEALGCLQRVMATSDNATNEDALFMSVKFIREPNQADFQKYRTAIRNVVDRPGGEEQDDEEENRDRPVANAGSQLQEIARIEPQWNPDRLLVNLLQNIVHRGGFQGCTIKELRQRCVGAFLRRPLENLLAKITRAPLSTQPPSIKHLGIIRDTILSGATALYVQYSLHNFQARVDAGQAFWEAVSTHAVDNKKKSKGKPKSKDVAESSPEMDEFGFPAGYCPTALFRGARGTIGQSMLTCQAEDLVFSKRDALLRTDSSGKSWIEYLRLGADKNPAEVFTNIIPDDDLGFLSPTPQRQKPKEPMDPLQFEKPKGRPRKYARGTEKFWREQFALSQSPAKRRKPKGKKSGGVTMTDPTGLSLFVNRPPQFDDTLVRAAENGLPVPEAPDAITQSWVDTTLSVLHRSAAGSYVTPKGVKIKTLGGKNTVSQILVIRSPRLLEPDTSKRKGTSFVRFLSSSAAHTFALPGPQFSKDLAQRLEEPRIISAGAVDINISHPYDETRNDHRSPSPLIGIRAVLNTPKRDLRQFSSKSGGRAERRELDGGQVLQDTNQPTTTVRGRRRPKKTAASLESLGSAHLFSSNSPHPAESADEVPGSGPVPQANSTLLSRALVSTVLKSAPEQDALPKADQVGSPTNKALSVLGEPADDVHERDLEAYKLVQELSAADDMHERDLEAYKLVQELSADVNNEDAGNVDLVESAGADQNGSAPPSSASLPELITSKVEFHQTPQFNKDGMRAGSVGMLRRKVFMELLEAAGSVMPLYANNLTEVYAAAWKNAGQVGKPDARTIKTIIKALCQSGTIKQIKFSHRNTKGVMVTKNILALHDMATSDPRILEVQREMIDADRGVYVPAALALTPKEQSDAGPREHLRWSSVIDDQKVETSPAEDLRQQLRDTLKRKREERQSEGLTPETRAGKIPRRSYKPLKLTRQTRQAGKTQMSRTRFKNERVPSTKADNSIVWKKATGKVILPTSLEDILCNKLGRKSQKILDEEYTYEVFARDIDGIARWEQRSPALWDLKAPDWTFINLSAGDDYRSILASGIELTFEGLIRYDETGKQHTDRSYHVIVPPAKVDEPCPTPPATVQGSIGQKFTNTTVTLRKRRRQEGEEEPNKRRRRAASAALQQPQTIVDFTGKVIDVSHLIGSKFKRARGPQFLRNMPVEFKRKIIVAVVVVRTLAGGLEKSIYWDLIKPLFPEYDEEGLQARWRTISRAHRRDVKSYLEDFQERFPGAYESGEIGNIDFDDLEAVDWDKIVDWASNNLGNPVRDTNSELPATKEELNQAVNLKFEATGRPFRDMFLHNQAITVPMREAAVSSMPFSVPVDSHSSSDPSHRPITESADDSTPKLARSWAIATINTPRSGFMSDVAHNKLQGLAATFKESEDIVDSTLRSLLTSKAIAKAREDHQPEEKGRRYVLSRIFHDNLNDRRTVNALVLKQASRFKVEVLDRAFRMNKQVRFDPTAIEDGHMVAILNLVGHDRIRIRTGNDVPRNRWGPQIRSKYKTRTVEKAALYFTVWIEHIPERYVFGNPLLPSNIDQSTLPQAPSFGTGKRAPIPLWRDIHGSLNKPYFAMSVAAVLGVLDSRPGASAGEVAKMLVPALGDWEVEALLDWGFGLGAVKKSGTTFGDRTGLRHSGSWTGGWEVEEWWWMVLAPEFEWSSDGD